MVDGGEQVVLTDEFDERTKWYRFLPVEMMCRVYSLSNPNIFMLSSFACCREKYNPLIHVGQCRKQQTEMKEIQAIEAIQEETKDACGELACEKKQLKAIQEETKDDQQRKSRGDETVQLVSKTGNFLLIFGCEPGKGVLASTKFTEDLTTCMNSSTSANLILPDFITDIESSDANFELSTPLQSQKLELLLRSRICDEMQIFAIRDDKLAEDDEARRVEEDRI